MHAIQVATATELPTFYHIGLFSICSNQTENQTVRNNDAKILDQVLKKFTVNELDLLRQLRPNNWWCNIEYLSFDVCNDFGYL